MQVPNVAQLLSTHIIPAGNGYGELEVSPIDPVEWVQEQAALRDPGVTSDAVQSEIDKLREKGMDYLKKGKDAVTDPVGAVTGAVSDSIRSVVIFAIMLLLGAGLVLLGGYQITRE